METGHKSQNNLELKLQRDFSGKTVCKHQYTSFPFRLSPIFRLEGRDSQRAYLYIMNTSPGLLAGDKLNISWELERNTNLYLTNQSATKVHQMPELGRATVTNQIIIKENACLEFIPEPIILYRHSTLEQSTTITIHSTARLFLSEIVVPGRLAREENYDFNYYFNRLQITDFNNKLLFADATKLMGKDNPFKANNIFSSLPIIGSAIAILPKVDLNIAIALIEDSKLINTYNLEASTTVLPAKNGILIRAMAAKTSNLKQYFTYILDRIRQLTKQPPLPYIPK